MVQGLEPRVWDLELRAYLQLCRVKGCMVEAQSLEGILCISAWGSGISQTRAALREAV